MKWPTMFLEKHSTDGSVVSMTRVVAFMFAIVVCFSIVAMAMRDKLDGMQWPFCALGIMTLLAVPVQSLFKVLVSWFKTKPGKALLDNLIERVVPGIGSASESPKASVTINQPES